MAQLPGRERGRREVEGSIPPNTKPPTRISRLPDNSFLMPSLNQAIFADEGFTDLLTVFAGGLVALDLAHDRFELQDTRKESKPTPGQALDLEPVLGIERPGLKFLAVFEDLELR